MKLDQRLIDEGMKEYVLSRACGCAFIIRTGDQVAYCPKHQKEREASMGRMRLTMIVHSVDGDTAGDQQAIMRTVELPDSVSDEEIAFHLLEGMTTHIDDELKAIQERGTILDPEAVAYFEQGLPHKKE